MNKRNRSQQAWSFGEVAVRRAKVLALSAQRLVRWGATPSRWPTPLLAGNGRGVSTIIHSMKVPIRGRWNLSQPEFEKGKRINIALAAPAFDGLLLPAGRPFSFWRTLGRTSKKRGFQYGMELAGGCIVPTLGGGICLLSNALFRSAALLGWKIVERHGHTLEIATPVSNEIWGLDATVLWPYVDLVFEPDEDVILRSRVSGESLLLEFRGRNPLQRTTTLEERDRRSFLQGDQSFWENKIFRHIKHSVSGAEAVDLIATNRKKLSSDSTSHRNCFSCGEVTCKARPSFLREQK